MIHPAPTVSFLSLSSMLHVLAFNGRKLRTTCAVSVCNIRCTNKRCYRLHCCEPFCRFLCTPFLKTSLSTFFLPSVSVLLFLLCELSPRLRALALLLSSSSPSNSFSLTSISSTFTSSSSSSSCSRFFPDRPVPPVPPPILTLTRGGTANPKDFATLARSRALTLNIFLSE